MFDDQTNQKPAGAPSNLPLSEAEDIFGAMPEAAPRAPIPREAPSAPSASALSAGALKPALPPVATPPPLLEEGTTASLPSGYPTRGPRVSRFLMILVVVAVVLALVGGAAWYLYSAFGRAPAVPSANAPGAVAQPAPLPAPSVQPVVEQRPVPPTTSAATSAPSTDEKVLFGGPVDSDGDGLSDYDEVNVYHTNPHNWDTDGDGLSDYDEVMIWHTDPNNPDTDHDGYKDGDEVKNGYNPNGPGKIFEPPKK